jgi:hypothetical protein
MLQQDRSAYLIGFMVPKYTLIWKAIEQTMCLDHRFDLNPKILIQTLNRDMVT